MMPNAITAICAIAIVGLGCSTGAFVWASDGSLGYRIAGAAVLIVTIAMCISIARRALA